LWCADFLFCFEAYVIERKIALDKYLKDLKNIAEIRQSYEFQQFLPKICHILAKTRYRGLNVAAKETLGLFVSQNVQINVNVQLKLIRITTQKNAVQRAALARSNIQLSDIKKWSEVSEKNKFKCSLELQDVTREFLFNSKSDLQIFTQLLHDREESKIAKKVSADENPSLNATGNLNRSFRVSNAERPLQKDMKKVNQKYVAIKEGPKKDYKIFVSTWNMGKLTNCL
jgi:hypothetical protein